MLDPAESSKMSDSVVTPRPFLNVDLTFEFLECSHYSKCQYKDDSLRPGHFRFLCTVVEMVTTQLAKV